MAGVMRYKPFCTHLNYHSQDFGGYKGGKLLVENQRMESYRMRLNL